MYFLHFASLSTESMPPTHPKSRVHISFKSGLDCKFHIYFGMYSCCPEVVLESLDAVSNPRAKPLKQGYIADLTR